MNSNKLYIITILTILFAIKVFAQRSILIAVDMRELLEFHQDEKGTFVCSNSQIQKLNLKYKCVYAKKLKQNHPFNNLDLFSLKFNTEESTVKVLEEFNNIAMVSVAEDNAPITNEEVLGNSMLIVPNDPLYPQQLGPSYMNFPDAWEISTGNHSIKVAIFDTGLDWYHPDLIDNIYVNSGEINENTIIDWNNGIIYGDGLDNDGNGYIDDLVGWDFASNDNNPIHPPGGHAHGTQVSGPLCAVGNNGQHACGMAWNASVMGMRLEGDWLGNSIEAIDYCITQHFDVINMSYGAGWLNQTLFHNKIEQAYYEHNILFVSIAQNYNQSSPIYPGAWPEVFAMGAVDQYDQKAEYSNYGNWVDAVTVNYQHGMLGYADGEHWSMIWDGATSTSAPLTSGLAILIKSSYPEWTNEKIFNQILITTDNIDQVNPNYVGLLGTGRINALRALTFNGDINENLI